jgi:hypothetical protein
MSALMVYWCPACMRAWPVASGPKCAGCEKERGTADAFSVIEHLVAMLPGPDPTKET